MKSIKPGRGPSMMGGLGSIFAGVFGVIWTMAAVQMGAGIFALFGVVFILFAVLQAVYQFKNATGENRYSEFDITEDGEEPDPLEKRKRGWPLPPPLRRRTKSREEASVPIAGPRRKRTMTSAAAAAKSCLNMQTKSALAIKGRSLLLDEAGGV